MRSSSSPSGGYALPAEWEPQAAVWLAWPHQKADWPGRFGPIPWIQAEIIRHISASQKVRLVVQNAGAEAQARQMLARAHANLENVEFFRARTNRGWMRDTGPVFVCGPKGKTMLDFRSTGWAKYSNHRLDNGLREHLNERLKLPLIKPRHKGRHIVFEGGGIDANGKGALLTTEEWLLSDTQVRNPGFTRNDYETIFAQWLGAEQVIWLGSGIAGDDTHGHVDDLARFVNPGTVAIAVENNSKDENHAALRDNLKRLKRARDQRGKPLEVVELPMPRPLYFESTRLPASYANFLITNSLVLVPTFNDPADRVALSLLAQCFPGREVVGIHSVELVWGFGTLHCMSMQESLIAKPA